MTGVPPKVLLIGSGLAGGGAETRLRTLAEMLFGGMADAAVFNASRDTKRNGNGRLFELGYAGPQSYPRMIARLRSLLRRRRYDAIVSLGLHQNALSWAATRGMTCRPALIMTETTRPHTHGQNVSWLRYRLWRAVYRTTYGRADLIAANSVDGMEEVIAAYGLARSEVRRIPNIVVPEAILRRAAETPQGLTGSQAPSICMVGRLERMKRGDTLVEAVASLDRKLEFTIDFIGEGSDRLRLEAMASALNIGERVRFHGWCANPFPHVKRARAAVLCSDYEGFSNTILEAMALGTPVLTSYCSSDARDMVGQGAALGFEVGDSSSLARHLAAILTDPGVGEALSRQAAVYIRTHTAEHAIAAYEQLIHDAIAKRSARVEG